MFLCSYLTAWGSPYNLKIKLLNMEYGLNLQSKVLITKSVGRCNLDMAVCLKKRGNITFVCMQLITAGFLHLSDNLVNHKRKTGDKFMTFSATFSLNVNFMVL